MQHSYTQLRQPYKVNGWLLIKWKPLKSESVEVVKSAWIIGYRKRIRILCFCCFTVRVSVLFKFGIYVSG